MHYGSFIAGVLIAGGCTKIIGSSKALGELQIGVERWFQRCISTCKNFVFGTEQDTRRYRDPLMELVAEHPTETILFMRHLMLLGMISGCVTTFPCLWFMWNYWNQLTVPDKPLLPWILANSFITLMQLPFRIAFVLRLDYLRRTGDGEVVTITNGFHKLTSSSGWCLTKSISLVGYGWYLLGTYWTFTSAACSLRTLCLLIVSLTLIRIFITVGGFYYRFPSGGLRGDGRIAEDHLNNQRNRLHQAHLELLPTPQKCADLAQPGDNCSICISEFTQEDLIRILPCKHFFHNICIDLWLLNSNTCPLCQRVPLLNPPPHKN